VAHKLHAIAATALVPAASARTRQRFPQRESCPGQARPFQKRLFLCVSLLSVVLKSESVYSLRALSSGPFHCTPSVQRGQQDCERLQASHRVLTLRGRSLRRSHSGRSLPSRLSAPHLRAARSTSRTNSKNSNSSIRHFLSGELP